MTQAEINEILEKHHKWLKGYPGGERADFSGMGLRGANFRGEDLRRADLFKSNLFKADFRGADLRGADFDFSCWPLWCGSLDVKVDKRIAAQLAYHFCRLDCDDKEYIEARNAIIYFANQFHRVDECGKLKRKEVIE